TDVVADGHGGDGQTGGDAYGGNADITATNGSINLGSWIYAAAIGEAGDASVGFGGFGGAGYGGEADIEALANPGNIETTASRGTITGGDAIVDAGGQGGAGGSGNADIAAGNGGVGEGG